MALENTNLPNAASDLVGIFDQNFRQIVIGARPIKVTVREISRIMDHPIETGSVISDHRIIMPEEIEFSTILPSGDYRSVYQQLETIFNAGTLLNVQTRTSTYKNMVIEEMPHQEDPDLFSTVSLGIRMRQAQIINTLSQALPPQSVKNPVDQSTANIGQQQPQNDFPLPPPVVDGTGNALPQIPPPPNRSTLNVPVLAPGGPNNQQYQDIYVSALPQVAGVQGP